MAKWRDLTLTEKLMIIILILLFIMILTRFDFIKSEVADTINTYFPADSTKN